MEWIDIIIGLFLAYEVFRGLKRGFLTEIALIAGLVVAFYAATAFYGTMAHFLSPVFPNAPRWAAVSGFLITFLAIYLFVLIVAKLFQHVLDVMALGGINRLAGGVFCFLKGLLMLSILLNLYEAVDGDRSFLGAKNVESSVFYKPVLKIAPSVFPLFKSIRLSHPDKGGSDTSDKIIV